MLAPLVLQDIDLAPLLRRLLLDMVDIVLQIGDSREGHDEPGTNEKGKGRTGELKLSCAISSL